MHGRKESGAAPRGPQTGIALKFVITVIVSSTNGPPIWYKHRLRYPRLLG